MRCILKRISVFVTALILVSCLCSCTSNNSFETDKFHVYCTVFPVYDLTKTIAGDDAEVKLMVPCGAEPHDWEPSTTDMRNIEKADVLITNGAGMEPWLDTIEKSGSLKNVKVLDASTGVNTIEEDHGTDPHIWLSFENTLTEIDNIEKFLSENDPSHSDGYKNRADSLKEEVTRIKGEYEEKLAPYKGETIVVSHDAFGYMCNEFGLEQMAIDGLSEDSEPDAKTLASITDFVKDNDIKAVFFDASVSADAAKTLSDETGCELLSLRTFETLDEDEYKDADSRYCKVMEDNLEALIKGLS